MRLGQRKIERLETPTGATRLAAREHRLPGRAGAVDVFSGGAESVRDGGVSYNLAISGGGLEVVGLNSGGGLAVSTMLTGSGLVSAVMTVSSGAVASGTVISGGGKSVVFSGGTTVSDSLVGAGPTNNAFETLSGGTAFDTTVSNTGRLTVRAGGEALFAVVNSTSLALARRLRLSRDDRLNKNQTLRRTDIRIACAAFGLLLAAFPALAQNVKITPIGSHPGELCANDRAIIFEDPTGVRFLYDTAQNVTDGNDPRLGAIHLVQHRIDDEGTESS
jgi:autotransporter passenger strand-loop-strand repeat protein